MNKGLLGSIFILSAASAQAQTQDEIKKPDLTPLSGILSNAATGITQKSFVYPLAAITSTAFISGLGIDRQFADSVSGGSSLNSVLYPVRPGVYLAVPALVASLFIAGKLNPETRLTVASYAVMQATAITLAEITVLKFTTGRPPRDLNSGDDLGTQSQTFHFGFGREGIIKGWPSGHTATVVAISSSMVHFYPELLWLKIAAYSAVAYTATAVTFVDFGTMHWFSDVVAGTFIGYSVGSTVGDFYREAYEGHGTNTAHVPRRWNLTPVASNTGMTAVFSYAF